MFNHYFKVKYYVEKLDREVELFIATMLILMKNVL